MASAGEGLLIVHFRVVGVPRSGSRSGSCVSPEFHFRVVGVPRSGATSINSAGSGVGTLQCEFETFEMRSQYDLNERRYTVVNNSTYPGG